jgi:hypothetical protein
MRRGTFGITLALVLGCLVAPHAAEAQQPVKVHRIGVLMFTSSPLLILQPMVRWPRRRPGMARCHAPS